MAGKSTQQFISIKGARVHNLKNVDIDIPKNKFVVITGLSGSGKSSLAFDTLYAEGQRRYVESLSSYARQFLGKLDKPEVDMIKGISPAIAIEQKVSSNNPRSTVGTLTEIYDYLRLLFARIGVTYSPISGNRVKRHTVSDVLEAINGTPEGSKLLMLAPFILPGDRPFEKHIETLSQQGFSRFVYKGKVVDFDQLSKQNKGDELFLLIDRFVNKPNDEDNNSRIMDSAQTAFYEGHGSCIIADSEGKTIAFSNRFELDEMTFEEPSDNFFSFNSPVGACKVCEGFGSVIGVDHDLVIPDKSLSIYEGAVACWKGEKMGEWKNELLYSAEKFDFPVHKPYHELSTKHKELLWTGNKHFKGLNAFFDYVESQLYKIQYRVMLSRYRGKTDCTDCNGSRIRKEANYVKINDTSISELLVQPVSSCRTFFDQLELDEHDSTIAKRLLIEIRNRLGYLDNVGLSYLTLNRPSATLSGGESQRINLATSLGSSLVGSMYILDEPSIGLHPRDSQRLISVLRDLQKIGNTVIVVEHEEEMMLEADHIIDMGPMAGTHGGRVVFSGIHSELKKSKESITAKYLLGEYNIEVPDHRRKSNYKLTIEGARQNNLKNVSIDVPLNSLVCVTGVSGSGKSTLIRQILYPGLKKLLGETGGKSGEHDRIAGDWKRIDSVEMIDQNPIGKSSRSNPVTYIKAFDEIRALFAAEQLSKINGYKPSFFSLNVPGGRCDACEGLGQVKIEMQFMADVHLNCESCNGQRFKDDILDVTFKEKSVADILRMTVDDAVEFFASSEIRQAKKIRERLQPLQDVGLGYIQLGQSSNTLSGGEAQRVKLAYFLSKGKSQKRTLFIFDEPTTGLHFHDIKYLLKAINHFIDDGHSVIIIEHNAEVIKNADWLIDIGPEGGEKGGEIVFEGTPEGLVKHKASYTGKHLKTKLA